MVSMFFNGAVEDDYVVNVDLSKCGAGSEEIIHGTLKSTLALYNPKGLTVNWYYPNLV